MRSARFPSPGARTAFALVRITRIVTRPIGRIFPWPAYLRVLSVATASGLAAWQLAALPELPVEHPPVLAAGGPERP